MNRVLGGVVGIVAVACGCGGSPPVRGSASAPAKGDSQATSCVRRHPGTGAVRVEPAHREGNAVALAKHGSTTVAYVADEDSRALHVVDVAAGKQTSMAKLSGAPAQVLVLADGRVAVTIRDRSRLEVFEPGATPTAAPTLLCSVPVPAEPFGLASTPDDKTLLVTSGWDRTLTALDPAQMSVRFGAALPREPRSVVVDDAGQRAFVSHVVGARLSVVDLAGDHSVREVDTRVKKVTAFPQASGTQNRLRGAAQGYALAKSVAEGGGDPVGEKPLVKGQAPKTPKPATPRGRIFVPQATVDPGDPTVRSSAYYGEPVDGVPKEAPIVSVIDADAERPLTKGVLSLGTPLTQECILPRAAAVRASTSSLFVTCLGIDALVELDTRGSDPMRLERRRWSMPLGPTGVAIDDAGARAIVWSQFDGKLSVVDLGTSGDRPAKAVAVRYEPAPEVAASALGRELFHRVDDRRISNDGVACASCHPEGREDAFTWATPEGPRQTIMLAGRAKATAPYGWQGKHGDLKAYLGNTFSRLGGSGLHGGELEAMVGYLETLPGPALADRKVDASEIARGKELFNGKEQGCASCHIEGAGIDAAGHDVGSMTAADTDAKFDTPSLRFIRGSGPYFHDGRYPTLRDLLAAQDSRMGHTAHLSQRDIQSLAAYLESL